MTDTPDHASPGQEPDDVSPSSPPVFGRVDDMKRERSRRPATGMPLKKAFASMDSAAVGRQVVADGQAAQIAKTAQLAVGSLSSTISARAWLGVGGDVWAANSGVLGVRGHQSAFLEAASGVAGSRQTLLGAATVGVLPRQAVLGAAAEVNSAALGAQRTLDHLAASGVLGVRGRQSAFLEAVSGVVRSQQTLLGAAAEVNSAALGAQRTLDHLAASGVLGVQGHQSRFHEAVFAGAEAMRAVQQTQLAATGALAGCPWGLLQDRLMASPAMTSQLGFSGLQGMVGGALDAIRSLGAAAWSSGLVDTQVRIQQAMAEAEDTSFALLADAMEAQQAALRGDHDAVVRFARRWMRRSMPKSWLLREPQSGNTSAFATALILIDLDEFSDGAFDLLHVLPKRIREVRRDESCYFDREVGDFRIGSIEARAEVAGLGRDELRSSGQDVENEALELLGGPENGGFDDSRPMALASTLSSEEMLLLLARANRLDWKQAAVDCGMSVEQGDRARDRIRYRANKIRVAYSSDTRKDTRR